MLGLGQTLIGQQAWEQAREHCDGALTRFQQSDDQTGQADAQFTQGLARLGSGQTQEAFGQFEKALELYRQQQQPLGEEDTHFELAGIYLERGQMEEAQRALTDAIALVERVMNTLSLHDQRRAFLQQYTELYALSAITQVRLDQGTPARQTLAAYARIAGSRAVIDYIKACETRIPVAGEDISDIEVQVNKNLVKRLKQLRNAL
jgi:tetratricopeptide (TPR) repeat protein